MSTYYYLYCRKCNEYCDFVGRWFPWRWNFLFEAEKLVPLFIARHSDHLEALEIVSEHDERINGDATEFTVEMMKKEMGYEVDGK